MSLYLGIDTSNYTTSVAVYDSSKDNVISFRKLLPVENGKLGIRQSDAVFHHTQQFSGLFSELMKNIEGKITAVGVSEKPRPAVGSYMPCFTVGMGYAKVLSDALQIPYSGFTHQHGHIAAGLYSIGRTDLIGKRFIAFHVSGGTTEALFADENFDISLIAETLDLNAGQAVDRTGAMLGLSFPAGKELEKMALNFNGKLSKNPKPTLKGSNCCLSGLQNICEKMFSDGKSKEEIAYFCLKYIEETLYSMSISLLEKYEELPVLFVGGVMSNSIIQQSLQKRIDCIFAKPDFSTDNAAGIAYLTYRGYKND